MATTSEHVLSVRVYLEDTDAQGVVYHTGYLRFFERARSELLDLTGYSMRDLAEGTHRFVVYEMKIRFRQPARLGDRLEIRTRVRRSSGYRITFQQQATKAGESTALVSAEVEVVCLDGQGKLQELPPTLSVLFENDAAAGRS